MNQPSEESLREKVLKLTRKGLEWHYNPEETADVLVQLIISERQAWAEYVIGQDRKYTAKDPKWYQKCSEYINKTKAMQRQRNTSGRKS